SGRSWAEDMAAKWDKMKNEVKITGFRGSPRLYGCDDAHKEAHVSPPSAPLKGRSPDPPDGWVWMKVDNAFLCVKPWAVEIDKNTAVPVTGGCGPVVAQRSAGTRGVGDGCSPPKR